MWITLVYAAANVRKFNSMSTYRSQKLKAAEARGGLKENIQFFSYRLAKPSKPIFFPKVAKSEAN